MATIGRRRPDGTYRARYRDRTGKEHARHFKRKVDAQRWLDEMTASIVTGAYVAPGAGRITFREYAEGWRAVQVHRYGTAVKVEGALRKRVYPVFGDDALESIVPSDIQALVKGMELTLSPRTVIVTYRYISTIFKAAVRDRRIALTPCDGIRCPRTSNHRSRRCQRRRYRHWSRRSQNAIGPWSSSRRAPVCDRVRSSA
jgi:hypothetical protein